VLREAYETMVRCRGFEERVQTLFAQGKIRGSCHLGIGQEAVAVGARLGTRAGDLVAPTYRGHNYALAWGVPLEAAFAEVLGKDTGMARGRGGSKHFGSRQHDVLPANAIVAANVPIACGTAWAAKLDGSQAVTVAVFGDGATNQAAWHEAMNLAAIWALPLILLCENNVWSEMTRIDRMVNVTDLADRADAYGMDATIVDGMDLEAVTNAVASAAETARAGRGPTLIEAKTYRYCGHMTGDVGAYRDPAEVETWLRFDPIAAIEARLPLRDVEAVRDRVAAELAAAEAAAWDAPQPDVTDLRRGVADFMATTR